MLQGLEHCITVPEAVPPLSLDFELRRGLLMILKEALHNAIRHAGATFVEVTIRLEGGRLSVSVRDDGRGFERETAGRGGRGLGTMRGRARELGGELQLESRPGAGTLVRVSVEIA